MAAKQKKINLALQGGGARGAFTWGVLDKFLEDGRFHFEGISATSAGSLNAIILAQGLMEGGNDGARELLSRFWHAIGHHGKIFNAVRTSPFDLMLFPYLKTPLTFYFFRAIIGLFSPYQFNPFNYNPIRDELEKMIDIDRLKKNSLLDLYICATNVKSGKLQVFSKNELSLNTILASCCLPHIFQAVEVNGDYYWDGGFLANPAIFPLIYNTQSQDILIIHTSPFKRSEVPMEAGETIQRMTEIAFNSCLIREIRAIAFVTKIIQNGWIKEEFRDQLKSVNMHCLDADHVLQETSIISTYNVDMDFLLKMFELGRETAEDWLKQNYQSVGKKSTMNFDEWI